MLSQLAAAQPKLSDLGADVLAIGPAAHYQAALLQERTPFPLLLDPDRRVHRALGIGHQRLARYVFNLPAWWRWLRALAAHRRQGRITGHYSNLPGLAVVDAEGTVRFVHRGTGLGDYPPLDVVLATVARLTAPE